MSSLLFVGVLGGLTAPPSSEAVNTTVTFQVDSGSVATVLDVASGEASTCTVPSGYSRCYALPTGGTFTGSNSRSYTIVGYGSGVLPRLLVTDTSDLDNLTLTTVEFKPEATTGWGSAAANIGTGQSPPNDYGERHTLTVVITHRFDQTPNVRTVNDASRYSFALRASGMFKGNPTNYAAITGATGSGDFVKFEGVGKFGSGNEETTLLSPFPTSNSDGLGAWPACDTANSKLNAGRTPSSDVNYCPLRRTIATTAAPTSSFSSNPALEQVSTYPNYFCDNSIPVPPGTGTSAGASARCTPTVILTLTATLNGPDSWVLSSSGDLGGGSGCNLIPPGPPLSTPARPCQSNGQGKKKSETQINTAIGGYFIKQDTFDIQAFGNEGAEPTAACVTCNCQDPDVCGVSITTLFNTGLAAGGSVDPHYKLTHSADESFPGPDAIVANPPAGAWVSNTSTSKWISPSANQTQSPGGGNPVGTYTYRTTFDLTGLDPGSASITGQWATDNAGMDILINGISTGQTIGIAEFAHFTPFSISTGFISGLNTLNFVTHNACCADGNPTGLRVEMSGTAKIQ